jgi:hypothetical protein
MNKNLTYYFAQPLNDKNFHCIYQLSATQLYGVILRGKVFVHKFIIRIFYRIVATIY